MKFLFIALICLLPAFSFAGVAKDIADDPVLESRMIHLAEKVRCLVCQSEPVSTSHSEWSQDVRNIMRDKMKAGATDQEILDMLVERFGKSVLYDPPVDNETMPLWGAPFVMLLLGGVFLYVQLKRRRSRVAEAVLTIQDEQRAATLLNESAPVQSDSSNFPHPNPLPEGEGTNESLRGLHVKDTQA
jgi:cytochrome c-type biogenesis protein CcmH